MTDNEIGLRLIKLIEKQDNIKSSLEEIINEIKDCKEYSNFLTSVVSDLSSYHVLLDNLKKSLMSAYQICPNGDEMVEMLNDVTEEDRIIKGYELQLSNNEIGLDEVPNEYQTDELVMVAIKTNKDNMKHVKPQMLTLDLVKVYLKQYHSYPLDSFEDMYISFDMVDEVVKENGWFFNSIPKRYLTKSVAEIALHDCIDNFGSHEEYEDEDNLGYMEILLYDNDIIEEEDIEALYQELESLVHSK